ncbi:aminotransferase class III-fold pyridoxal phosphate-dependent enzyme [Streptomyces sp. SID12488]|uniref:aspartate aminotransferase family protein n=1 Tax=Streptomyces sp. SID12488 TaxID=2706040 RepID=UPI0013DB58D4|nr:aminotransferase class III-fold pyridoxal phosphate-dependent enzyme [Streptomyces sp. SID12488]NEA65791.1 aminotransferase class III-fold pyridoxal phosphate-dependent enzyme [Streptomyces sp. SID12488]
MNENFTTAAEPELAEPYLRQILDMAGLAVEYVRAEANTLYMRDEDGTEIPVADFAGGYGSVLLGHNHPEITAYARDLLAEQTPIHAQFSRHPYANRLAAELNRIIARELSDDEPYYAIFGNSGAESVEAAVKHAELDRGLRVSVLLDTVDAELDAARTAVAENAATVHGEEAARLGVALAADDNDAFRLLEAEIRRRNSETVAAPPLFLALEGGFHGKLAGSVQLTHNESYRLPFKSLAAQARFVPQDGPEALRDVHARERRVLLGLSGEGGRITVTEHEFPVFCAFLVEPIQGEGGIRVLSPEFAREIQEFCAAIDCPLVVDEIQSGMGRTGTLLASSRIGLRGDYYTLAKTLGGGIAKASVMLVREKRYRRDFEVVHSSTFAKDSFSCHIALRVLDLLERDGGAAYRQAEERGAALHAKLDAVRAEFPDVVLDVRGRGLMQGLEFRDQSDASSPELREIAGSGLFGYFLAGHLLRRHRVRTFPTASAVGTLRFEPSIHVTDTELEQLYAGLRDVCTLLRKQAGDELTAAGR